MSKTHHKITLTHPIKRGNEQMPAITLRKPLAGELKGIKLLDLLQMDVSAYVPLLPRISEPALTETEIHRLDPADLLTIMTGVQGFFLPADSPAM